MTTISLAILIIEIIIGVAIFYLVCMFILSQVVIPNLGRKQYSKEKMLKEPKIKAQEIGAKTKTKQEVLEQMIAFQLRKFYAEPNRVFTDFFSLWDKSFNEMWTKGGFIHCHQHNFVLRNLLIASKRFNEEDIKLKITFCYSSIHQYLKINISDNPKEEKWIDVDPFAIGLGFNIGEVLPHYIFSEMKKRNLHPAYKVIGKKGLKLAKKRKAKISKLKIARKNTRSTAVRN